MQPSDEWTQTREAEERRAKQPEEGYGLPPSYGNDPGGYPNRPKHKKSKWVSALLSFLVPGTGHMYLGLMVKGISIMLLLALNICAIVYFAVSGSGGSVLIIVLLSLLLPILYFYSLFDSLQQTEALNERYASGWPGAPGWHGTPPPPNGQGSYPQQQQQQVPLAGVVLLAAGGVALFSMADTNWTKWLLHSSGSMAGAVILLAIGAVLWFWERRGGPGRRH